MLTLYASPGWNLAYGLGGETIFANSGDYMRVYGTRSAYSTEAEELVTRWSKETPLSCDLRLRIEEDGTLPPAVREAALKLLYRQFDLSEVNLLIETALMSENLPSEQYALALRRAGAMLRSTSKDLRAIVLTGMGQYRTGALKEALSTLDNPLLLNSSGSLALRSFATLAMTCQKLSQPQKAREYLDHARQISKKLRSVNFPRDFDLVREAETIVDGKSR
jgi:tetratricopeptide (TPR) repeat protein